MQEVDPVSLADQKYAFGQANHTAAIQSEIRHLLKGLCVFYSLRNDYDGILDGYARRLKKAIATHCEFVEQGPPSRENGTWWSTIVGRYQAFRAGTSRVLVFLRRIPWFLEQRKRIVRLPGSQEGFRKLILAAAANRLHGIQASVKPREYFTLLTSDFLRNEHPSGVDREIAAAEHLFVCEPLLESPLWKVRKKCWNDGVLIVDAGFLLFLGLISLFTGRARYLWQGLRCWKFYHGMRGRSISPLQALRDIFAATLFYEGYRLALGQSQQMSACFLTSNSFVTEILRFYLVAQRRCTSLCEVMHGIPTVIYERYLADMLKTGAEYAAPQRHSSISQLPRLPMFGVLLTDVKCSTETAVNTYLNKYWIERKKGSVDFAQILETQFQALFSQRTLSPETLIVTFVGGMTQYQDCFRSDSFQAECFIMQHVKKILDRAGRPHLILYTPHPGYPFARFQAHKFFLDRGIVVYPDTIFTWFLSDICLSLYSSALFEAAYFGVHAFTPTVPDDEIFPEILLNQLNHPKSHSLASFIEDLSRFLESHAHRPPVDVLARAKTRARRFKAGNEEGF